MNLSIASAIRHLGLLLILLWAKCSLAATPLICVSVSEFDDNFRNLIRQDLQDYGHYLNIDMVIENASSDPQLQLRQVRNFIATRVDAMIILPVNTDTGRQILQMATQAKMPVVFANSNPEPDKWPAGSAFVGSQETDAGTLEMEQLAKLANYKGKVVILEGEKGHPGAIGRTKAVEQVVSKYPDMKVVKQASANWQSSQAANTISQWLKEGVDFNIVAANNDEMAIGAILGLEKSSRKPADFLIGGVDGTREALAMMDQGKLKVSVLQDARGQAREAVNVALKLFWGSPPVESLNWIPFKLITPENAAEFK